MDNRHFNLGGGFRTTRTVLIVVAMVLIHGCFRASNDGTTDARSPGSTPTTVAESNDDLRSARQRLVTSLAASSAKSAVGNQVGSIIEQIDALLAAMDSGETARNDSQIRELIVKADKLVAAMNATSAPTPTAVAQSVATATPTATPLAVRLKWLGSINDSGNYKWGTSGAVTTGTGDGALNTPMSVARLGSYLYVLDQGNQRIVRYQADTGDFGGWIGRVATAPSGGATGCTSTAIDAATPGWCTGGTSKSGTGDGMFSSLMDVALGPDNLLYVLDANRIIKIHPVTGAFQGWIGEVLTSPTGGEVGCAGRAIGTYTPGWCLGGTAGNAATAIIGGGSGMSIAISPNGSMYVAYTYHIAKYVAASGQFIGWAGMVITTPDGGEPDCTTTTSGFSTPGWCTGGMSRNGTYGLQFDSGAVVTADNSNVYAAAADSRPRLLKLDAATGAYLGWAGRIEQSPTGGDVGCAGAGSNTYTTGWCTGGYAAYYGNVGWALDVRQLYYPNGIALIGSELVVSQAGAALARYSPATGAFIAWTGLIATSPTGGDAGCNGAAVSTYTPGWCTGGLASSSNSGIATKSMGYGSKKFFPYTSGSVTTLYISEAQSHRLLRVRLADAQMEAWMGQRATTSNAWRADSTASVAAAGDGMLASPGGVVANSMVGGNLDPYIYVASLSGSAMRINRYDRSTGVFGGWMGAASETPTGCSLLSNSVTNGWCQGGTAGSAAITGFTPFLAADGTYLYLSSQAGSKVSRFNKVTGVYGGWIGMIGTSPTGGAAGCNGAAVGYLTPGWCTGGQSKMYDINFSLFYVFGMGVDASVGKIYLSTWKAFYRFDLSTGVPGGWLGTVSATPSGGAAGCTTTTSGNMTPGWCTGGSGMWGLFSEQIAAGGGSIYGWSNANGYLARLDAATGAETGWIGTIDTVPTGGAAGCTSASIGDRTPGWCTGGSGSFSFAVSMSIDSSSIYMGDGYGTENQIERYDLATGAFGGWYGLILTTPTGGASGCSTALVGTLTPGFCLGGASDTSSTILGALGSVAVGGISPDPVDQGFYFTDSTQHRLIKVQLP